MFGGCGELACLSPDERLLKCLRVLHFPKGYRLELAGAEAGCACPKCGVVSMRLHGRYRRRVRDLPLAGRRVVIDLVARKFVCLNQACARRIFCERFAGALAPHARTTLRLEAALTHLALNVSAKAAERLGRELGYPGSASTLLRRAHRYQPPAPHASEISVDEFAFRRGRNYGTIIVDLATRRPIELLSERSVASLKAYLEAHPEVRLIARDRDPSYTEAITWAAPTATVVADRWHLIKNISDAFERLVASRNRAWRQTLPTHPDDTNQQQAPQDTYLEHRQHLYQQTHQLHRSGWSQAAIARHLHLDQGTIRRYLHHHHDNQSATPTPQPRPPPKSTPTNRPPNPRALAYHLLNENPNPTATTLLTHNPDARQQTTLARTAINAIRQRNPDDWNNTLKAMLQQPPNNHLHHLARNLHRDHQAITNALTHPHSQGPTEGNINRLKLIKRTMYGRASFQLLRNKILYHPTHHQE